jgi:molecular chaperone DnaK
MLRALALACVALQASGLSPAGGAPVGLSVGIDLGTSRSCVAIVDADGPRVIANALGEWTTESVLQVDGREVVSWKRAIGLSPAAARSRCVFPDPSLRLDGPVRLTRDFALQLRLDLQNETSEKEVEMITGLKGESRLLPSDASTLLLRKLIDDASLRLGAPVANAVIGVPAMFDAAQRAATKRAAEVRWRPCRPSRGPKRRGFFDRRRASPRSY